MTIPWLESSVELPRWSVMWLLAFYIFCGCKFLTFAERTKAPRWKHLAYFFAWPGLDANAFLHHQGRSPERREWLFAFFKMLLGLGLMMGIARGLPFEVGSWIGKIGLVLSLHFGLFHILSWGWRTMGIDAKPLMNWPILATSVSDFWSRRWNTAFRDLTHRFLFRPLTLKVGAQFAAFVGFLFSGLIHDLVISWPAGGGYGLPTLYFMIQWLALVVERSRVGKRIGLGSGLRGWMFTTIVLLGPVTLLLHKPFIQNVIGPFLQTIGAIP